MNLKGNPYPSLGANISSGNGTSDKGMIVTQKQFLDEYMPIYWACMTPMGFTPDFAEPNSPNDSYHPDNLLGINNLSCVDYKKIYSKMPILGIPGEGLITLNMNMEELLEIVKPDSTVNQKLRAMVASWYLIRSMYSYQVQLMFIGHKQLLTLQTISHNLIPSSIISPSMIHGPSFFPDYNTMSGNKRSEEHIYSSSQFARFDFRELASTRSISNAFATTFSHSLSPRFKRVLKHSMHDLSVIQEKGASMIAEWTAQLGIMSRFGVKSTQAALSKMAENAVIFARSFATKNKDWVEVILSQIYHVITCSYENLCARSSNSTEHPSVRMNLEQFEFIQDPNNIYFPDWKRKHVLFSDLEICMNIGSPTLLSYLDTDGEKHSYNNHHIVFNNSIRYFMLKSGGDLKSMNDVTSVLSMYAFSHPNVSFSIKSTRYVSITTQKEFKDIFTGTVKVPVTSRTSACIWRPKLKSGYDSTFIAIPGMLLGAHSSSQKNEEFPIVMGMLRLERAMEYRYYSLNNYLENIYGISYAYIGRLRNAMKNFSQTQINSFASVQMYFNMLLDYMRNGSSDMFKRSVGEIVPDAVWTPNSPFAKAYEWPSVSTMVRGYMRRAGKVPIISSPIYSQKTIITILKNINGKTDQNIGTGGPGSDQLPAVREERDGQDEILLYAPVPVHVHSSSHGTDT